MSFTPTSPGQKVAYRAAKALSLRYSFWTADPPKAGEKYRIPYLKWTDDNDRAAYLLLCLLWRIPIEA